MALLSLSLSLREKREREEREREERKREEEERDTDSYTLDRLWRTYTKQSRELKLRFVKYL